MWWQGTEEPQEPPMGWGVWRNPGRKDSLGRLQWLCWHRAGDTRQGTALLGCDSATASPGHLGNKVPALDVIAEAPNRSWLLCWCERSINIPGRIAPGWAGFHQVEQSRRLVLDFTPFPTTRCIPKKFSSKRRKARGSLDVNRAGFGHADLGCREFGALEQPLP